MSSYRKQQKLLDQLKKYERNFDRKEYDEYKMFLKRQKDDEDFDSVSMTRLEELHDKYHKPVDTSKYDAFFKKNTEDKT
ncbi:MAG: hypothetical protein KJN64_04600 [Ignavibacteria bacterium]|nr:hypothetical protein [Ignavibacteria bacterium]MBT8381270.1 hypothetical protein [Ignavibacteria bacterium]MBT8390463.1 hypothetical protein [Ignavibacteria bacterium]NNJ53966.1 hypothetical protein [Ignavibacteriaceae bacterium]